MQTAALEASILDAAQVLFTELGFDATGMEAIAARSGISKGTLYTRYPSKDLLLAAVVRHQCEKWAEWAKQNEALEDPDLENCLRAHAHMLAEGMCHPEVQSFIALVLGQARRFPQVVRVMYDTTHAQIVDRLSAQIAAAAVRDNVPVRDARAIASRFTCTISGWYINEAAVRRVPLEELMRFSQETVTLFLAARHIW